MPINQGQAMNLQSKNRAISIQLEDLSKKLPAPWALQCLESLALPLNRRTERKISCHICPAVPCKVNFNVSDLYLDYPE